MDINEDFTGLLDGLKAWCERKERSPMSIFEKGAEARKSELRIAQGELATLRALRAVLDNPAEKLRKVLDD